VRLGTPDLTLSVQLTLSLNLLPIITPERQFRGHGYNLVATKRRAVASGYLLRMQVGGGICLVFCLPVPTNLHFHIHIRVFLVSALKQLAFLSLLVNEPYPALVSSTDNYLRHQLLHCHYHPFAFLASNQHDINIPLAHHSRHTTRGSYSDRPSPSPTRGGASRLPPSSPSDTIP
jgi:hypothetical protein